MADTHATPHAHAHEPHAAPMWILLAVFGALLVLTGITVYTATHVELGEYNLLLAMVIAVIKGALVALFFMHLFWDSLFNGVALISGLAFLAVFISFSLMDTWEYQPQVLPLQQVLTPETINATVFPGGAGEGGPASGPAAAPIVEEHLPKPAPSENIGKPATKTQSTTPRSP